MGILNMLLRFLEISIDYNLLYLIIYFYFLIVILLIDIHKTVNFNLLNLFSFYTIQGQI